MTSTKEALRSLLAERAVIRGRITLSSGVVSEYYFDCKRVMLDSQGAPLVGEVFLDAIKTLPEPPLAIGGLTHGADPIIGAAMMKATEQRLRLDGFYIRKEPKKHGTQRLIENAPESGTPVVIVDDVDEEKVSATFKNGVLTVTMPKLPQPQSKVKRIAINGKQ